jgi:hypothetical protein
VLPLATGERNKTSTICLYVLSCQCKHPRFFYPEERKRDPSPSFLRPAAAGIETDAFIRQHKPKPSLSYLYIFFRYCKEHWAAAGWQSNIFHVFPFPSLELVQINDISALAFHLVSTCKHGFLEIVKREDFRKFRSLTRKNIREGGVSTPLHTPLTLGRTR